MKGALLATGMTALSLLGGSPVAYMSDASRDARLAALTALIALRAGMEGREVTTGDTFVIEPDSVLLDQRTAVLRLERLPKPLECRGRARRSTIVVACHQITDPNILWMHGESARARASAYADDIRGFAGRELKGEFRVLIYGYLETALVPLSAVEHWIKNYRIVPSAMTLRPATVLARAKGAVAIIDFDQGEFRMIEESPPE